ncbi:hypothetical protein AB0F42_34165 [Streptomyces buecherae]|uniref:hypothetical protein n=1 Tax=Streptomyces buecherae TaxID=2763006 RepID=UPI0033E97C0C
MKKIRGRSKQYFTAIAAMAVAATVVGSVPAHAEGSRTSYIKAWNADKESSRWHDSQKDKKATKVQFKGCNSDNSSGFSAPLTLYRAKSFAPDPDYGKKTNKCNTSDWGETKTAGDFYFKYHSTGYTISVKTVNISW